MKKEKIIDVNIKGIKLSDREKLKEISKEMGMSLSGFLRKLVISASKKDVKEIINFIYDEHLERR